MIPAGGSTSDQPWYRLILSLVGSIRSAQIPGARSPEFCTMAHNVCGSSVWNFPHVTFLVHRILWWHLKFWKVVQTRVEYLGIFLGIRWSGREDFYTFLWCRGDSYLAVEEHLALTVLPQPGIDHCSPRSYFQDRIAPYHHSAIRLREVVPPYTRNSCLCVSSEIIRWIQVGYFWDMSQKLELVKLLSKRSPFFRKLVGFEKLASFWVSREVWIRRKLNVPLCIAVLSWVVEVL